MKELRPVLGSIALIGVLVALWASREALGIESNPTSIRDFVAGFGFWGPLVLVLVIAFRVVLLVPSPVVLIAAGICFGTLEGTLYGALGLVGSALWVFALARYWGREAARSRLGPRVSGVLDTLGERPGAAFLAGLTAYPVGPLLMYWMGAALTGMAVATFLIAVAVGSVFRAGTYVFFGSALFGGDLGQLALSVLLLLLVMALPLLSPSVRAWLRRVRDASRADPEL